MERGDPNELAKLLEPLEALAEESPRQSTGFGSDLSDLAREFYEFPKYQQIQASLSGKVAVHIDLILRLHLTEGVRDSESERTE